MEEKEFFRYDDVTVTNARFVVASQTYAMRNITSVKASKAEPNRTGPIILFAIGLLMLFNIPIPGVIALAIAVWWWTGQATYYHVVLTTSGGESKALTSTQSEYIDKVVSALNDAIVHRG